MVWLADSDRRVLARNDNASSLTKDAHLRTTLQPKRDYRVEVRDARYAKKDFVLSVTPATSNANNCALPTKSGALAVPAHAAQVYADFLRFPWL